MSRQLDNIRNSKTGAKLKESVDKLWEQYQKEKPTANERMRNISRETAALEGLGQEGFDFEAIVLAEMRPAYFVLNDQIQLKDSPVAEDEDLVALIRNNREALETALKGVGRVNLYNHWNLRYAGTGWLIAEDIVVTNRHVAQVFANKDWNDGYRFKTGTFGDEIEVRMDYLEEHESNDRRRADVREVLYFANDNEADIAFLRVETRSDVKPVTLSAVSPSEGTPVAAVGYPAWDGDRNDPDLMRKLFGGVYGVKRFAPGYITGSQDDGIILTTDYTSLGGNSGSPVFNLDNGEVLALHFAGAFRSANYVVAADIVAAASKSTTRQTIVNGADVATEAPTSKEDFFAGRDGYQPRFLGNDYEVSLPALGAWVQDVAPVTDDANDVLKYRHFSVIQSKSRRFPILTAVNIDGEKSFRLKRKGSWKLDGRLEDAHQIGNVIYFKNALDRGHLVRRMDPGWGDDRAEAQQGERDTFHYTVCAPQHEDLNQKDWLGLEDYLLESARNKDFKVSVFTGPIYRDDDKTLRNQPGAEDVKIPEEFWKVAVIVTDEGKLSATGYVLSHGKMIRHMVEAPFVYGEYKTYQVQIAKIEAETGLDFGGLRDADPLGATLNTESAFAEVGRVIDGPEALKL